MLEGRGEVEGQDGAREVRGTKAGDRAGRLWARAFTARFAPGPLSAKASVVARLCTKPSIGLKVILPSL